MQELEIPNTFLCKIIMINYDHHFTMVVITGCCLASLVNNDVLMMCS